MAGAALNDKNLILEHPFTAGNGWVALGLARVLATVKHWNRSAGWHEEQSQLIGYMMDIFNGLNGVSVGSAGEDEQKSESKANHTVPLTPYLSSPGRTFFWIIAKLPCRRFNKSNR